MNVLKCLLWDSLTLSMGKFFTGNRMDCLRDPKLSGRIEQALLSKSDHKS